MKKPLRLRYKKIRRYNSCLLALALYSATQLLLMITQPYGISNILIYSFCTCLLLVGAYLEKKLKSLDKS